MCKHQVLSRRSAFEIYDASAGSGKTFNLTRNYLARVLADPDPLSFRNILAITFTNKAVAEMKQRIVEGLIRCTSEEVLTSPDTMTRYLLADTGLTPEELRSKAKLILNQLLQHYGGFSVETIDGFNHRLIRTFARDLRIPSLFEVELDTKRIIAEGVDRLVSRAGEDEEITPILLEFALQKTEDDKSWDISRDLKKTGEILAQENHFPFLQAYLKTDLASMIEFRDRLSHLKRQEEKRAQNVAGKLMEEFELNNLEKEHFSSGYLYVWFLKVANGRTDVKFGQAWQNNLGHKNPYPGRVKGDPADAIDALVPRIIKDLEELRNLLPRIWMWENVLARFTPLSVIKLIDSEIQELKEEQGILPIYEFNRLISQAISEQPTPFIYERLGNRYFHFMVDEFQDTSIMQWQNLLPLVENTLAQDMGEGESGSLLLVGDAKQSIYRWRGGWPEQFIALSRSEHPFAHNPKLIPLKENYRSLEEVVKFNNALFTYAAGALNEPNYADLYKRGNDQQYKAGPGGYVTVDLIDGKPKAAEKDPVYCDEVLKRVNCCIAQGYQAGDICILTRKKDKGAMAATFLIENGFRVVSSDSLLIGESPIVRMLIELMRSVLFPEDKQLRFNWLNLLYDHLGTDIERHDFLQTGIESPGAARDLLKEYRLDLPLEDLYHLPLYAFFEKCIHELHIDKNADGFVFELMDVVLDFSLKPLPTKLNFLEFWDEKQDSLSVSGSPSDAIRVMTVHKSKGLEFPVVIFPWANQDTYTERDALAWLENEEFQTPFDRLLVSPKGNIVDFGPNGDELYHTHRNRLELDQLNILYVALTRAKEQLHIISEQVDKPGKAISSYQNLICNYLDKKGEWSASNYSYHYGKPVTPVAPAPSHEHELEVNYSSEIMSFERLFTVSAKAEMWRRGEEQAVAFGTSLHELLAEVQDTKDIEAQVDQLVSLTEEESSDQQQTIQWLRNLGSHPETATLFDGTDEVWTEKEILVPKIGSIRPDRVNLHPDGTATVADYKTGSARQEHHQQLMEYSRVLDEMGIRVKKRLIIYFTTQGLSVIMV